MSDSPDRRRQILDVALVAFSNSGYHNTSMTDIAEALSVTKPVVYQFFDSKRALYLELLRDVARDLTETVTHAIADADNPKAQVEGGMHAYFTWVSNNREAFALLFESSARVDEEFADIVHEFEKNAAKAIAPFIIADDLSADDQLTFAVGIVGMAETVSRQILRSGRDFNPDTFARALAEFTWGGLRSAGR